MENKNLDITIRKSIKTVKRIWLKVLVVIILVGILKFYVKSKYYTRLFTGNKFLDVILGAIYGSIALGSPTTSYFISNLLIGEVFLGAIISFLISWVLVGLINITIESEFLGKNFAIARNIVAFIFSLLAGFLLILVK